METVNNVAAAASRAIWGDTTTKKEETTTDTTSGQEPISGVLGNVKAGEPYDKGNEEDTSEPKTLTKTSSKEITSSDSSANLPSTANPPSVAAHTTPLLPEHTQEKKIETSKPMEITLPRDEKTDAATKAGLEKLENQAKELKIAGDLNEGAEKGDGLLSAKKVGEGEGVNTGVKSTSEGLQPAKEPISVMDPTKKTTTPNPAAATSSTTTTPAAATQKKSESSSSSEEDVEGGGKKKKLSLKEKIKAKLHKH